MRSNFFPALLVSLAVIFFMSSCSKKSNTIGRYIPEGAAIVVHVNTASMSEKLPWSEIKQNELFQAIYTDTSLSSYAKAALDNPESTGIDMEKDLVFFMIKDSLGGYVAVQGTVKDAAKFKAYNTAALAGARASEKNGVQYLVHDRTTVTWDKDKFIVLTDAPEMSQMDDVEKMMKRDSVKVVIPKSTRDGIAAADLLYALKKENSLADDEKFSELLDNKGDLHFWSNTEALYAGNAGLAGLSMLNISKLYQGSFTTGTVEFENGKIDVDMKSYAGKELTELMKKYSGGKISAEMVKRLPAKDVAVLFAMNFKPEGLKEFVKLIGVEGLINMGAAYLGFNVDDFVKANKGDILFAVSDITKDTSGKMTAALLFSASKGDKASFEKLVAAGKKLGSEQAGPVPAGFYFNQNDKYFSIGTRKEYIDAFVTKDAVNQFPFFDNISSGPIGGYANLQYIMNSLRNEASRDTLAVVALDASLKMWDNILLSGGDFSKGGINQHVEINLVDKTTNSLKQLNKYAAIIGSVARQKKAQDKLMEIRLPGDQTGVKDSLAVQ